jgi:hypothetical protein
MSDSGCNLDKITSPHTLPSVLRSYLFELTGSGKKKAEKNIKQTKQTPTTRKQNTLANKMKQ